MAARPARLHAPEPVIADWLKRCEWALSEARLGELAKERPGLDVCSLIQAELGWDAEKRCYVLPVRDLTTGAVVGYREGRLGTKGRTSWKHPAGGTARLYAPGGVGPGRVLLCEGE